MKGAPGHSRTGAIEGGVRGLLCGRAMRASLVAAALAFTLVIGGASAARACVYGGCEAIVGTAGVAGSMAGIASLCVIGKDLAFAFRGEPQTTELAIANLALGVVDLGGGIALALAESDILLGFGLGFVGAGLAMLIDGIVALAMGPGEPRSPPIGLMVSASAGGVTAGVLGRF